VTTIVMDMEIVDYESFKRLWDEDRTQRGSLGVQTYKIFRPLDDPFEVILHYEVTDVETAEEVVAALRNMLDAGPLGKIVFKPDFRICDEVASGSYASNGAGA
jgi:hypothetical protein